MDELDVLLADFNRLKENCRKLEGQKIVVGIVGKADSDVLKIAHAHEYGVPGKLPERSFIRASFDADKAKLEALVDQQVSKVLGIKRRTRRQTPSALRPRRWCRALSTRTGSSPRRSFQGNEFT